MASGTKATSQKQGISQEQTYGRSEHRVKILALQEEEQDLTEEEVASLEKFLDCLEKGKKKIDPSGLYTKTLRACFHQIGGGDYLEILASLDELGYDVEWQNINSKWFVPQNRERIYTIGHLREQGGRKVLPIKGSSGENHLKQLVQGSQANRVYNSDGISCTLSSLGGGQGAKTGLYAFEIDKSRNNPEVIDTANCIRARENRGLSNRKSEGIAVLIPVLTPERISKRQNGRRFKDDGEPMFTLTTQDRHGVAIDLKALSSSTRGQPFRYGHTACLDHNCYQGVVVELKGGGTVYAVWSEKYDCYLAIRKLTPKECFRLQGWTDEYFEKAKEFNSDSQLYKQAGNGATVDVVKAIGEKLREQEND